MENCSFHSQILSVMEVLATAAVAEINRRVNDSCAVLRLEVSQSRRDIDLLRRKCEVMETELRRTRMRAKRKAFYPPAAERFIPVVKVMLTRERQSSDWGPQTEAEAPNQPQQCAAEAEHILIKEECAEEDVWRNDSEDKLTSEASGPAQTDSFQCSAESNPAGSRVSPTDDFKAFPEEQLGRNQTEEGHTVKHERGEEPDENGRELVTEEGDRRPWSSAVRRDAADPSSSYAGRQFEPIPSAFPPRSGMHQEDAAPRVRPAEKSQSVILSSERAKRRARAFGCDEEQSALSQVDTADRRFLPQQPRQRADSVPHTGNPNEDLPQPNPTASSLCGHRHVTSGLPRRMRAPWRSGVGEKRFSCSYCNKSFMRFSQLKEHLRSHTGEKPFSCLQCGRSFTKQCNLIRHAVVHSGEKPYECSLCGKCFTQRSSLKSHQKTAH